MKLSLFVALVAVAAASSSDPEIHSVVYKPGEEYVYHYRGHVLSGIPLASKQYSGLLIDTLVTMQFRQDSKVIMKLDKIKLFKINNEITTSPSEQLSESDVTRLTGEQANVLTEYLVKPIKFQYEEGEVRELEKESRDRYWSVNIKKGILSLFQVTLKEKRQRLSDSLSMKSGKDYSPSSFPNTWNPSKQNSVFKVMETDVTGECETKYTLIHDRTHMSMRASTMHVTSVRNYNNCLQRPFYIQGIFQGVYVHDAEQDLLQPFVHTDYVITGDRSHFLIREAELRGKYMFMPNGLEGIAMSSFVYQSIKLRSTESISKVVHLVDPKPEKHGLLMVIPKTKIVPETSRSDERDETRKTDSERRYKKSINHNEDSKIDKDDNSSNDDDDYKNNKERNDSITSVIEEQLSQLVHCLYPVTEKQCTVHLVKASRLMRMLSKEELKPLIMRHIRGESDADYRKSEILLDVLPTLPSPDAAKVLFELIRERHISEFRGAVLVKVMSLTVKPTPVVVKAVFALFKGLPKERGTIISPRRFLRKTLLLSVGTLTHRLINVMRSHDKPLPEVISFLDNISSTLRKMLEEGSSGEEEKVLILKAMGNMGASETIPTLKRLVEDRQQPIRVRVIAVFALRRLAKQLRKQVFPILMSSFMDFKEEHDVRRAAFVVIIDCNPSFLTLQTIAHLLRKEPSSRIRTLVYSSLINLAQYQSHEPEHKELRQNARLVIKTIPAVPVGVHDSMSLFISKFSEDYDFGGSFTLKKFKSKMSGLPEGLVGSFQATLFGKHRHLLQTGAEGKALEVILRKIFGPHGFFNDILKGKVSFSDFWKPLSRTDMGGLDRKIKEVLEKMKFELQKEDEPLAECYLHVFGHELGYIVFNAENVEDLTRKLTTYIPEMFVKLARGVKVDILKTLTHRASLTIASPLGVPLFLNFTTVSIFKVDGHIRIKNLPSWSDLFKFPISLPKMTLEVDLKPTVDASTYFFVGANMRWLSTGAGFEAHLCTTIPAKLDVVLDGPEHTVAVKYYYPGKSVKVYAKIAPVTMFFNIPTTVAKLPFTPEIKEIKNKEIIKVTHFEYKYKCEFVNAEFEVHGQYSICGTRWCPRVFGKQEITLIGHPISSIEYLFLKIKSLKTNFKIEGIPANQRGEKLDSEEDESNSQEVEKPNYRLSAYKSVDFDPITVDSIFENEPIKRQIFITYGINTRKTPMGKSLFTWLAGRRLLKHQVNVQVIYNAQGSLPEWKLSMNKVTNLEAARSWIDSESKYEDSTNNVLQKFHFLFKYGNKEEQEVKLKITPGSPFDISKELLAQGIETADCLPKARAQKYKYTLEAEFKHMNSMKLLKYISNIKDVIKNQYYEVLTTAIPRSPEQTKLIVAFELLPWWEQMNIVVKTPVENVYIYDVPFYCNPFLPTSQKISLHDLSASSWYRNSSSQEYRDTVPYRSSSAFAAGECLVDYREHSVNTYDGSDLNINSAASYSEKGCWTLLTQDCSNHCLFSVLSKNTRDGKVIKMLVPKYEIVFQMRERTVQVLVNNKEMTLSSRQPIVLTGDERDDQQSSPLYEIEKKDSNQFKLKANELGITIIFDLERLTTNIKVSPMSMLQGQLCGLCGNYNQDQSDEYMIPDNLKVSSDRPVLLSHFVPSETCDIDNIQPTEDYCRKESKYVTIRRSDDNNDDDSSSSSNDDSDSNEDDDDVTCRSEKKISQCAPGCRPQLTRTVKTCFTCDSENVRSSRSKNGKSSRSENEKSSHGKTSAVRKPYKSTWDRDDSTTCEDFYQDVEVPTRCVPAY